MPKLSEVMGAIPAEQNTDDNSGDLLYSKNALSDHNPDDVANAMTVAKKNEVPLTTVLDNKDIWLKSDEDKQYVDMLKKSPKTASWMFSPENAAIAKDDVAALAGIENSVSTINQTIKRQNFGGKMVNAFFSGMATVDAGIARAPAAAYNAINFPNNLVAHFANRPDLYIQAPDWLMNNKVAKYFDKQAELFRDPIMEKSIVEQISKGDIAGAAENIALQVSANAPTQFALYAGGVLGKGMQALAAAGTLAFVQKSAEAQNAGADPAMGTIDAAMNGFYEAAFESAGTMGVLKHWENAIAKSFGKETAWKVIRDVGKTIAYSFLGEGTEETLTSLAQDFADYVTGVNRNALVGMRERAINAGMVGAFAGATSTAPVATASGMAKGMASRKDSNIAVAGPIGQNVNRAESYKALGDQVKSSKLYQRSPEKAAELVAQMVAGSEIENIYVPVEEFTQYFQSQNISPDMVAQELGIEESFKEAVSSGRKIRIPTGKWVEKVVNTPHFNAFAENYSTDPDGLTEKQKKVQADKFKSQVEGDTKLLEERIAQDEQTKQDYEFVYNDVVQKLSQLKRPSRMNPEQWQQNIEANAKLVASKNVTTAIRRGVPVNQVYNPQKIRVENASTVPASGEITVDPKRQATELRKIIELSSDDDVNVEQIKGEVKSGQAGHKYVTRDQVTGEVTRAGYEPSTYPEYFKNKGYTKKSVLAILDKVEMGEALTKKQQDIFTDLLSGYKKELSGVMGDEQVPGQHDSGERVFDTADAAYAFIDQIEKSGGDANVTRTDADGKTHVSFLLLILIIR